MKKFFYLLLVNTSVFVGLLLLFELIVRLLFPQIQIPGTDRTLFKDSIYYSSAGLLPNARGSSYGIPLKVNGNGFWQYTKSNKNRKKVLYLGDSVTMGIGAESDSTFAGIINNEAGFDVLNSAMIGYSGKDYLNIIKKLFIEDKNRLNISEVKLFWCLNDIYDYYPYNASPEFKPEGVIGQILNFFRKNFKLFYFIKDSFADRPKSYYLYDEQFYNSNSEFFKNSLNNLLQISDILKEINISLEIFLFPYEFQLRTEEKLEADPQKLLKDSLTVYGLNSYNLTSLFIQEPDPEELFLFGDGIHFSHKGHRLVAEYIKKSKLN